MSDEIVLKDLSKKFPEQEIEWRVQQCGMGATGSPWALIIPYVSNRAIQQRLDDVAPGKWQNDIKGSPCGKGYLSGISILIDGEWVTRWDGAEIESSGNIDDVKSVISRSMKRTGSQWGIGRYLYQFEIMWADCKVCDNRFDVLPGYTYQTGKDKKNNGAEFGFQWRAKPLEEWALPVTDKLINKYLKYMEEAKTHQELFDAFSGAYKLAASEDDKELVGKFTEAKDEAKQKINDQQEAAGSEEKSRIEIIVDNEIKIISTAINESSAKGLREISIAKMKATLNGNDLKNAITLINHATRKIIEDLGDTNGSK